MADTYPELDKSKDLPKAPVLRKSFGVGLITVGLALGTGELILWPHLTVKYGLGILWAGLLGITLQYFINQEVARNAMATGESFFTASSRILRWFAPFWLISTLLLYIWPGWAGAIGATLAGLFGFGGYLMWAWAALLAVFLLTLTGKVAYVVLEKSFKIIVPTFFVLIVIVSFLTLKTEHLIEAGKGLINFGFIPQGIDINVFFGAIVFAGAGGLFNLCVSLWYRDKQAGMGRYVERITNPITSKAEAVSVVGYTFEPTDKNLFNWKKWLRYLRFDQGISFWLLGLLTLILLSVNAYVVLTPLGIQPEGVDIVVAQANVFGDQWGIFGSKLFLFIAFLMLFSTMWSVLDAAARVISDILYVNSQTGSFKKYLGKLSRFSLHHLYYATIIFFIIAGAILLPYKTPFTLLVISSVLGGFAMAIYTPLLLYMNNFKLPKELRPGWITNIFMVLGSLFYLYFVVLTVIRLVV